MAVSFDTLAQGTHSGISDAVEAVITSKEEWSSLWKKHTSKSSPPPELPDMPFDTDMIVYVFSGQQGSGGHSVSIKSIEESSGSLRVVYETTSPPPGAMCTMALTQPHHIVRLKKCDLPVTFSCTAAAPPAPVGWTKFLLTFDAAQKDSAAEKINSMSEVLDVKSMFGGDILCVQLDTTSMSVEEAQTKLQQIDGVKSVERDS